VLAGSPLATLYKKGKYAPLSLEQGVMITKKACLVFREKNIRVIRMGLQAIEDLREGDSVLAGSYHPAFGHLVHSAIFLDNMIAALRSESVLPEDIIIKVHPKNVSELRGLKNHNIAKIKSMFDLKSVRVISDLSLPPDEFKIDTER
jgi:hypothetical protein